MADVDPDKRVDPCNIVTQQTIRFIVGWGTGILSVLFLIDVFTDLDFETAIEYSTFVMAFVGLTLSLAAAGLSYVAYRDSTHDLKDVILKLGRIEQKVETGYKPTDSLDSPHNFSWPATIFETQGVSTEDEKKEES